MTRTYATSSGSGGGGVTDVTATYLKLDTSNGPLTGNLNISKTEPKITLTDNAGYTSLLRRSTTTNTTILDADTTTKVTGNSANTDSNNKGTLTTVNIGTVWTTEFWVKHNGSTNGINYGHSFLGSAGNYWMYFFNATTIYYGNGGQVFWTVSNFTTGNTWRHFLMTRNGGTLELFINGVSQGTKSAPAPSTADTFNTFNGYTTGAYYIPGVVDEAVIWNKVLDSTEIAARYNSGLGAYATASADTVGIWHFDESAGTTAADSSGNGNNITMTSASWSNGLVSPPGQSPTTKQILKVTDGVNSGETAAITYGNYSGVTGTYNLFDGFTHRFDTLGTARLTIDSTGDSTFTGRIKTQNGTAALPAISPSSDTNTGIYFSGADDLLFTTAGVARMSFNNVGTAAFIPNGTQTLNISSTGVGIGGLYSGYSGQFNVQNTSSAAVSKVTAIIKQQTSQTGDLTQYQNNSGTVMTSVGANGLVNKYNQIATVSNGIPTEYATVDLTAQSAAKTATTLYTPTASGMYRISIVLQVTRAASTSSILGGTTGVVITYTEPDGSVAQSVTANLSDQAGATVIPANGNIGNTTTTVSQGSVVIYAKTGVAIQYAIDYASVGATSMQYSAHLKLEAM